MSENNDFALVPGAPGSLEKAEPGARRILSDMVTDTLALVRRNPSLDTRHKILLVDDDPCLLDLYRELLVGGLPGRPEVQTALSGPRALAMLEAEPFQLMITGLKMPKMDGLELLAIVRQKYPKLRTVMLTAVRDEQFRLRAYALGADLFFNKSGTEEATKVMLKGLQSLLERTSSRPLRIVTLDDETSNLTGLRMMLGWELNDAKILTFQDAKEALDELAREQPDLFTTDWIHAGMPGSDILALLAKQKAKYPIFIISACAESIKANDSLRVFLDQGLNVSLLSKPLTLEQLRPLLLKHVSPGNNPQRQSLKEVQ